MLLLRSLITGDPGAPAGGGTAVVSERPEVRGWMGRLDMETRADFFWYSWKISKHMYNIYRF